MDKIKKKLILERNKRQQRIVQQIREHQEAQALIKENAEALQAPESQPAEPEEVWSAKTQEIRNRLTGKKRSARERWNRFAGTSGGGGMGR